MVPGGFGVNATVNGPGGSSATANAAITATLTWQPAYTGEPPPENVIVTETATASGNSGASPASASGSVSDSLGANEVLSGPGSYTFVSGGTTLHEFGDSETGTRYSVKAGANIITVNCAPSATASSGPGGGATATIVCNVTATPVVIALSGTNSPSTGDNRVLTGSQITASLSGTVGTVTSYTWTPSPTQFVFKNYDPSLASSQLTMLGSTDLLGPAAGSTAVSNLVFYDCNQESLIVNCSVTMTAPDGATVLKAMAASPTINVLKPTSTWGIDPSSVPVNVPVSGTLAPNSVDFYDQSLTTYGVNTTWYPVTITVPVPFSGGSGCFAQLVTPSASITRTPTGSGVSTYYNKIMNAQGVYFIPGTGLDKGFPYPFGFTTDSSGNVTGVATSSSFTAGSIGASGDNPQGVEGADDVDMGGTNWSNSQFDDKFNTWLMFKPTGGVWIPLQMTNWEASASASGGPTNWSAMRIKYTAPSPSNTTTFPTWSLVIPNQSLRP